MKLIHGRLHRCGGLLDRVVAGLPGLARAVFPGAAPPPQRVPAALAAARRHPLWRLGGLAILLCLNQLITGVLLLVYYQPGPNVAYDSVRHITEVVPLGWLVRQLHAWGSHLLMLAVLGHMLSVFLRRTYRAPRQANWVIGTGLFLLAFGFAFTGGLLPWDQQAFWSTTMGLQNIRAVPLVGESALSYLLGGAIAGDVTLARCFTLHTVVLPWLVTALVVTHLHLARRHNLQQCEEAAHA